MQGRTKLNTGQMMTLVNCGGTAPGHGGTAKQDHFSNYTEWLRQGGRGIDTALTYTDPLNAKINAAMKVPHSPLIPSHFPLSFPHISLTFPSHVPPISLTFSLSLLSFLSLISLVFARTQWAAGPGKIPREDIWLTTKVPCCSPGSKAGMR